MRSRLWKLLIAVLALALAAAACGNDDSTSGGDSQPTAEQPPAEEPPAEEPPAEEPPAQEEWAVAFFAASSENGFNQAVYSGVQEAAAARGNVTTEIFNGEFNAEIQSNQIQDAIASGRFDAFVVLPNDTVGIAVFFEEAIDAGYPIATTLFPVGPDLTTLAPQVEGITATVAAPPADGARVQAEAVVEFCRDLDPCNVVIIIGQLIYPFDNVRHEAFLGVLDAEANINVVATVEGNYDPDASLTGMTDVLQANEDIHVVLSNADQHLQGAEIALVDAGYDLEPLYLSGGGAAKIAIDAINEGRWDATLAAFPASMGSFALDAVVDALEGGTPQQVVNMDEVGPVDALITKEVLDANPDFEPQWVG